MRKKTKSDPIDGFVYEVTQLPAREGRGILVALTKVIVPTLGAAIPGAVGASSLADVDLSDINFDSLAHTLAESLDESMFARVCDAMVGTTEVWGEGFGDAGAPLVKWFDDHFAGRYLAMLKWLAFALRCNFLDFFDALEEMKTKAKAKKLAAAVPASQGQASASQST
jgi:hypothetical protein